MARARKTFSEIIKQPVRKTKPFKWMGAMVDILPLTVAEVRHFQAQIKEMDTADASEEDNESGLAAQRDLVRMGVVGAAETTDEELDAIPMAEVRKLTDEILKQAGIEADRGGKG